MKNLLTCCAVLLSVQSPIIAGEIITQPTDGPYRLAFISNNGVTSSSSDIATYNGFITAQANQSAELTALGTSWYAFGSTEAVDARDNTKTVPGTDGNGIPIYDLLGNLVAASYADLWDGSLLSPITTDQFGTPSSAPFAQVTWSGTSSDGVLRYGGATTGYVGLGMAKVGFGQTGYTSDNWITSGFNGNVTAEYAMLGISDVISTAPPVPEPSTIALLAVGLLGIGGYATRKRRNSSRS